VHPKRNPDAWYGSNGCLVTSTLALAAHTDLKVVQAMLGHASIVLAADTYISVLPTIAHEAAQETVRLVLTAASALGADARA
jgi:hypothetical protein